MGLIDRASLESDGERGVQDRRGEDSDDAEDLEPIDNSVLPEEPKVPDEQPKGCKFRPIITNEVQEMKKDAINFQILILLNF